MVKWNFISPLLRTAKGFGRVENISFDSEFVHKSETLLEFTISKKDGQTGFSSIRPNGMPTAMFKRIEEHLKLMVDSYFHGMLLRNETYHWMENSLDKSLETWLKETEPKGLEHELDNQGRR